MVYGKEMKKIIRPWHGGLGDSLQLSTLPEMLSKAGHDVYISLETPFRNKEIYDLVWRMNPYVIGGLNEEGNCGEIEGFEYQDTQKSFIKNWEKVNGLKPTNNYPKIYYHPKDIVGLHDVTLIDLTCHSLAEDYMNTDMGSYIEKHKNVMYISHGQPTMGVQYGEPFHIDNILDYCDAVYSCKKFVCLSSGGNPLASSIKRFKDIDVDCLVTHSKTIDSMHQRKLFFFDNINYVWI